MSRTSGPEAKGRYVQREGFKDSSRVIGVHDKAATPYKARQRRGAVVQRYTGLSSTPTSNFAPRHLCVLMVQPHSQDLPDRVRQAFHESELVLLIHRKLRIRIPGGHQMREAGFDEQQPAMPIPALRSSASLEDKRRAVLLVIAAPTPRYERVSGFDAFGL